MLGLPISAATYDPATQLPELLASASIGACVVVLAVLLRLQLSWTFVGQRLQLDKLPYEESGWYDGQVWMKSETIIARDRLVYTETVAPALARVKGALLAAGLACSAALATLQLAGSRHGQAALSDYELARQAAQQEAAAERRCDPHTQLPINCHPETYCMTAVIHLVTITCPARSPSSQPAMQLGYLPSKCNSICLLHGQEAGYMLCP